MRELFTITCSPQPGPARPGPHGRLRTGLPVAVGLGLLLLALAGCTQASPPLSSSQDPAADPGIATAGETPGTEPPVDGDTTQEDTARAETPEQVPRVTIEALVQYVTLGGVLRFRMTADPAPSAPLTVNVRWHDPHYVLSGTPKRTVTIPTSGTADFSAATLATLATYFIGDRGHGDTASVHVFVGEGTGYTGADSGVGVTVRGKTASPLVSITAQPLEVNEGDRIVFTLTANPPPRYDLTVNLNWYDEYLERFAQAPPRTVKLPAFATSVSFSLPTKDDLIDNYGGDRVVAMVWRRNGYGIGTPAVVTVTVVDDEFTSNVSVAADATHVDEGDSLSFTLTADPPPAHPLTVNLGWKAEGHLSGKRQPSHDLGETPPDTATIPTSGTAKVTVTTVDDDVVTFNSTVEVTLQAGVNYFAPPATSTASITIRENDFPHP
ncbi:MAG: hypothetical protein OXP69_24725 [Spirochaetaceae bacterium]|nr:hypothetical protein [Spirochaetaceae bacterium]